MFTPAWAGLSGKEYDMKKKYSILLALVLLFASASPAFAAVVRDETVYVSLEADGSVKTVEVVNRLSGSDSSAYFTDYGKYKDLKILVDGAEPEQTGEELRWKMDVLKTGDIYYMGTVDKKPPVDIKIEYFLDDKKVTPENIAGADGDFEIRLTLSESDLTLQTTVPLSLEHFRNIETDGMTAVTGKTMNIAFTHLPGGEGVYYIKGKTEDFTLSPIQIAGTYQSFDLGEDNMGAIDDLTDGLHTITGKMDELAGGASQLQQGVLALSGGLGQLQAGLGQANNGFATYLASMGELGDGMVQFSEGVGVFSSQVVGMLGLFKGLEAMPTLLGQLHQFGDALHEIREGYEALDEGQEAFVAGLEEIIQGHREITSQVEAMAQMNPQMAPLAEGLAQELYGLETLYNHSQALRENERKLLYGLVQLDEGFMEAQTTIGAMAESLQSIQGMMDPAAQQEQTAKMQQFVQSATMLQNGLKQFQAGGFQLFAGYEQIYQGFGQAGGGIAELAGGAGQLSGGVMALKNQGMVPLMAGIEEAMTPLSEQKEKESFVDQRNQVDSISFVMQTKGVKKEEVQEKVEEIAPPEETKTFWDRVVDLFT